MKVKKLLNNYLFVIIIIITNFSLVTFARYVTSIYGLTSARVALFQNSTSISLKDIKGKPGAVTIVPLYISNYDNDKISEVNSEFTINISRDYGKNIPLIFGIYKDKECTEIVYRDELENFFDDSFTFEASKKENKNVFLRIEWPSSENKYENAFEIDYLTINFRVSQID